MTSVRPTPKFDDDKTYPVVRGSRVVEVLGSVLNCKERSQTKTITMDEWYTIQERFEYMESMIAKLTKRIHTLEEQLLG